MRSEPLDVPLTVTKSDWLDDWYIIKRAKHDGRNWVERRDGHGALMCSSRINNADIEGTRAEMLALAKAIKAGGSASFWRCGVTTTPDGVLMCSPRNSTDSTLVATARAMELADQILALQGARA
jgi:glycine/D-amino acid oxidase-like deaminating enzyme